MFDVFVLLMSMGVFVFNAAFANVGAVVLATETVDAFALGIVFVFAFLSLYNLVNSVVNTVHVFVDVDVVAVKRHAH